MAGMTKVSPISAGLQGRCPTCGQGRVWRGYLKFKPACEACGQDFTQADTADGPAFFVGFFVLIILAPFAYYSNGRSADLENSADGDSAIITIVVSLILLLIANVFDGVRSPTRRNRRV